MRAGLCRRRPLPATSVNAFYFQAPWLVPFFNQQSFQTKQLETHANSQRSSDLLRSFVRNSTAAASVSSPACILGRSMAPSEPPLRFCSSLQLLPKRPHRGSWIHLCWHLMAAQDCSRPPRALLMRAQPHSRELTNILPSSIEKQMVTTSALLPTCASSHCRHRTSLSLDT